MLPTIFGYIKLQSICCMMKRDSTAMMPFEKPPLAVATINVGMMPRKGPKYGITLVIPNINPKNIANFKFIIENATENKTATIIITINNPRK